MVQAADLRNGDRRIQRWAARLDVRWVRHSSEVGSCSRGVGDVLLQHGAKARRRQHDDMVEALAPHGPDEAFDIGVLPRGPRAVSTSRIPS